jgi:hypothetical protein
MAQKKIISTKILGRKEKHMKELKIIKSTAPNSEAIFTSLEGLTKELQKVGNATLILENATIFLTLDAVTGALNAEISIDEPAKKTVI